MAYVPTTGSGSALAAQNRDNLRNFTNWLTANNVKGAVTETGIPGSSQAGVDLNYDPGFYNALEQQFIDMDTAHLHVTLWESGEWNEDLKVFRNATGNNTPLSYRTTTSSVLGGHLTTGGAGVYRGVNLSGAEFSDTGPNGGLNAGTLYQQYYFPKADDWTQLKNFGVTLVRLPIRWERLQPTLLQPLDATHLGYIKTSLADAAANNIKVLLDVHNYGRYDTAAATNTTGSINGVLDLGQNAPGTVGGTMQQAFTDFWGRVATALVGTAGLWAYGICNEPNALTGGVATWQTACQNAVEAIRLKDQSVYIGVGGYAFQGIQNWVANNTNGAATGPWLTEIIPAGQVGAGAARNTDPLIFFEGHMYYDYDGTYSNSAAAYSALNQAAINAGYAAYTTAGYVIPAYDITSQTGLIPGFASTFSAAADFGGTYDKVVAGTNTVTIPYTAVGDPKTSMQVITTATSDTGGAQKSTTAALFNSYYVDFMLPAGATVPTAANFSITHFWKQDDTTDLIELRIVGSGSGYLAGLVIPSGTYAFVNSGNTVLPLGQFNTLNVVITATAINLYVNGSTTIEASIAGTFTGVTCGGFFVGKFYGTSYVGPMYFGNLKTGNNGSYDAPPNGGALPALTPPPPPPTTTTNKGLMEFLYA
jgi:aryl-phospho-beta-D-glucosidase BglC (GH1 family)